MDNKSVRSAMLFMYAVGLLIEGKKGDGRTIKVVDMDRLHAILYPAMKELGHMYLLSDNCVYCPVVNRYTEAFGEVSNGTFFITINMMKDVRPKAIEEKWARVHNVRATIEGIKERTNATDIISRTKREFVKEFITEVGLTIEDPENLEGAYSIFWNK